MGSSFKDFDLDISEEKLCVECTAVFREIYDISNVSLENDSNHNELIISKYKAVRKDFLDRIDESENSNIKSILQQFIIRGDMIVEQYDSFESICESVIESNEIGVNKIAQHKVVFNNESAFGLVDDTLYYIPYGNYINELQRFKTEADCNAKLLFLAEIENIKKESGGYIFEIPINSIDYFQERGNINYSTNVRGGGGSIKGANLVGAVAGKLMFGNIGAIIGSGVGNKGQINEVYSETIEHDNRYVVLRFKQADTIKELKFDFSCFDIFVKLIPEKDHNALKVNSSIDRFSKQSNDAGIPVEQIKQLKELNDAGLISDEEYALKKAQLLGL